MALALAILAGWAVGNDTLTRLGLSGVAMMPDTALGFFLAALAVAGRAVGSLRRARLVSNLAAAAVGLLAIAEWAEIVLAFALPGGASFHFHLLPEPPYQLPASPQAAFTFLLASLALLLAGRPYLYVGYLAYGAPGARARYGGRTDIRVEGPGRSLNCRAPGRR